MDGEVVDSAALTDAIRYLIKGTKPASKDVHLGAVSQRMVARQVDLPWVPQKEFAKALPLLAADLLPMPVEDCVLDFLAYEEVLDDDGSRMLRGLLVAAGDVSAFEQLYARHRQKLYRYLLRHVRDPALADELFQDVWQKLIAARTEWTPAAGFSAFNRPYRRVSAPTRTPAPPPTPTRSAERMPSARARHGPPRTPPHATAAPPLRCDTCRRRRL